MVGHSLTLQRILDLRKKGSVSDKFLGSPGLLLCPVGLHTRVFACILVQPVRDGHLNAMARADEFLKRSCVQFHLKRQASGAENK